MIYSLQNSILVIFLVVVVVVAGFLITIIKILNQRYSRLNLANCATLAAALALDLNITTHTLPQFNNWTITSFASEIFTY